MPKLNPRNSNQHGHRCRNSNQWTITEYAMDEIESRYENGEVLTVPVDRSVTDKLFFLCHECGEKTKFSRLNKPKWLERKMLLVGIG